MTGETKAAPRRRSTSKNGKRAANGTSASSASSTKSDESTNGMAVAPNAPAVTTKRFDGRVVIVTGKLSKVLPALYGQPCFPVINRCTCRLKHRNRSSSGYRIRARGRVSGHTRSIRTASKGCTAGHPGCWNSRRANPCCAGPNPRRRNTAFDHRKDCRAFWTHRCAGKASVYLTEQTTLQSFFKVNNAGIMKPESMDMDDMSDSIECYDYIFAVNVRRSVPHPLGHATTQRMPCHPLPWISSSVNLML